jgi:hypothetical protein
MRCESLITIAKVNFFFLDKLIAKKENETVEMNTGRAPFARYASRISVNNVIRQ